MTREHFTFSINGQATFVALTDCADAVARLAGEMRPYLHRVIHDGNQLLHPAQEIGIRASTATEIARFEAIAVTAQAAGRIDEDDVADGYPIFLIDCIDPTFPGQDINTGLPIDPGRIAA